MDPAIKFKMRIHTQEGNLFQEKSQPCGVTDARYETVPRYGDLHNRAKVTGLRRFFQARGDVVKYLSIWHFWEKKTQSIYKRTKFR